MQLKSSDLFGIGKKYTLKTGDGECLVVIIHHNGNRELYFLDDESDDSAKYSTNLNDSEARKIGAILMGADYQPATEEQARILHEDVLIEWVDVDDNSSLKGKTIEETELRSKLGVTIIGVQRKGEFIGSPDIDLKISSDDTLMVTGKKENINQVVKMCKGEG